MASRGLVRPQIQSLRNALNNRTVEHSAGGGKISGSMFHLLAFDDSPASFCLFATRNKLVSQQSFVEVLDASFRRHGPTIGLRGVMRA